MSEYDVLINKYDALNAGYDQLYPKPMKHANTHASGGTDPITPGDIGAYSKTETNTLLQNKAPAGYGLGGNGRTVGDWNTCLSNGWYQGNGSTLNGPDKISASVYGAMLVVTRYSNTYQLFVNAAKPYALPQTMARRWTEDGGVTWSEWEYINPPMKLGVEYRTTERYLGKPVYVKVIQAGFNPAGTAKNTLDKTASASGLVRFSAVYGGWSFPSLMYGGNYNDNGNVQVAVQATSAGIYVTTFSKARDMTSETVNVSVYYTKD